MTATTTSRTAAAEHPELSNLHDLRTRTSGNRDFVQFHVDLPGNMTVGQAHDIIERVENDLCRRFPAMELLIHIDPEGHVDEPDNPLVEEILSFFETGVVPVTEQETLEIFRFMHAADISRRRKGKRVAI